MTCASSNNSGGIAIDGTAMNNPKGQDNSSTHDEDPGSAGASPSALRPKSKKPSTFVNIMTNWIWYALNLVAGFIVPRFIDSAEGDDGRQMLGIWDFGWSLVVYINLLTIGVSSAVTRYVARFRTREDFKALNATVMSSLVLLLANSLIGLALAGCFVHLVPTLLPDLTPSLVNVAQWVVGLLALSMIIQLPSGVFNAIITGHERFDLLNLIRGIRDAVQLFTMIALLLTGFGIIWLAAVVLTLELLADIAKVIVSRYLCPQLHLSLRHCNWKTSKEMVQFGGKTVAQSAARAALYQANSLVVGYFLGPAMLAVYARQRALAMHMMKFVKQYAQVFIPSSAAYHAEGNTRKLQELLVRSSRYGFLVALPIASILICMAGPLLNLWMGPDYEAPMVLTVMVAGHVLSVSQLGVYSILLGMNKHGLPAVIELICAIVGLAIAMILLGKFDGGMISAAFALSAPLAIATGIILPIYACRQINLSLYQYIAGIGIKPVIAVMPLIACLLASRFVLPDKPTYSLTAGLTAGGFFTLLVYWRWVLPDWLRQSLLVKIGVKKQLT